MQTLLKALHGWKERHDHGQRTQQRLAAALQCWRQNLLSRAFQSIKEHIAFRQHARQVRSRLRALLCTVTQTLPTVSQILVNICSSLFACHTFW